MARPFFSLLLCILLVGCGDSGNTGDIGSSLTNNKDQVQTLITNGKSEVGNSSVAVSAEDSKLNTTESVSQNGQLAINGTISRKFSPSGYSVAVISADNSTQKPLQATAASFSSLSSDAASMSGHVYHWRSHELITDVTLRLSKTIDGVSSELASTTTDAVGEFSLAINAAGEKNITAAKEMTANDQNKVITSADALAALKIAVGLNPNADGTFPVSPYQMIAADVNKDGRVNSADALQILKIAVGLSDAIPQEWLFVSEAEDFWDDTANNGKGEFTLTNKDVSWGSEGLQFSESLGLNSNLIGVLLGDVNGSWSAPEGANELTDNYFAALEQAGIGPSYQWFSAGDSVSDPDKLIAGKVIDGYIEGADVYLDINYNAVHDNGEPKATSLELGSFKLEVTDEQRACLAYAPIRVDVPVGAVDADLGAVTSAFAMVLPPTLGYVESSEQLNVTPLTSVLWDEIEELLVEELGSDLTCEKVKANISSLDSIEESLSTSISNIVRHYNIPADKIFADYIAEGNAELSTKAELIVKGLKKSFAETAELRTKYPQAGYAEVSYFVFSSMDGDQLYPNAWYRETAYQDGADTFVELNKISDDLETDIRLIYQAERSSGTSDDDANLSFGVEKEIESRGGDDSGYSCNYKERITYTEEAESYELINLTSYTGGSNSIDDCEFESFAESGQSRYVFWSEKYSEFESEGSQFTIDFAVAKQQLSGWNDYESNLNSLDPQTLLTYVDSLPKKFCQQGLSGANQVERSKSFLDGDVEVTISRSNDGSYSETRYLPNGTQETNNYQASENPTFNSCTTIDTDSDGVNDYYDAFLNDPAETLDTDGDGIGNNADNDDDNDGVADVNDAAPLDARVSFITARRDIDGDGIPNANDPDKDNDGFDNAADAFPLDETEWLDSDADGIGNNSDDDDDGDGLLDSADEFPADPNNVLDDDNDGIANRFDVDPSDANIDVAVKLNFDGVDSLGVSEAIASDTAAVNQKSTSQKGSFFARILQALIPSAIADTLEDILASANNLIALALTGDEVEDAVLASRPMFIAETVLSPDGRFLYMLTGTSIQSRLSNTNLPREVCQLYRVDLENDDAYRCIVDNDVDFEINTISISNSLRDDYRRKGITFRADGTGLLQVHTKQLMIFPDGTYEIVSSEKTAAGDDYQLEDELGFWLDDEHYAIIGSNIPLSGGGSENFFVVKNILTGQVVDEADPGCCNFVQQGNKIYANNRSYEWNGTSLVLISQIGQPVQDYYGNLWSFDEAGLDDSKTFTLTDSQRNISVPLSENKVRNFASDNQSGTGTDIKYKQYDFKDNYVLHKFTKAPVTPITAVNGVAYDGTDESLTRRRIALGGNLGYLWVGDQGSPWGYFKSGNEDADVSFSYTVNNNGSEATKTFTIPLKAIQNHSAKYSEIKVPPESGYLDDLEPYSLFFPTPESEQVTFCLTDITSSDQRCAELNDYKVLVWDFESRRNDKYFPDEYYVCPGEDVCNAYPGVLQVLFVGDYIHAYFKDSTDNTYYLAKSSINNFMQDGDSALEITSVVNGAGESEILAGANKIDAQAFGTLSDVSAEYQHNRISVTFGSALNRYANLPALKVVDADGKTIPLAKEVTWANTRDSAQIYLTTSASLNQNVTVTSDDWFFLKNSTERYAFPEDISVTVTPAQNFVLDDGMETVVTDFVAANNNYVELFSNLEIANNSAKIDLVDQPLNGDNIANLLANDSSAHVPRASIPIRILPVGQGSAGITIKLYAGDDTSNDSGERYADLSFSVNWEADGSSALFRVPAQEVSGKYITSSGQTVEITIENFDEDVIGITTGGVNYPSSLDVRFMQVLNKVNSVLPTNILVNGEYRALVTTDLPLIDQDGNTLDELLVKFKIGN